MSASSVTRTRLAAAASVAGLEVVMPCLQQHALVFLYQRCNSVHFILSEAPVIRQPHGLEPELRRLALARHVHMGRFALVA